MELSGIMARLGSKGMETLVTYEKTVAYQSLLVNAPYVLRIIATWPSFPLHISSIGAVFCL